MGSVIIFGANRGIGLGFTQQYLDAGCEVIATYRDNSTLNGSTIISDEREESLKSLSDKYPNTLSLYQLDITDKERVKQFASTVKKVDLLILNAGIKGYPTSGTRPQDHDPQHLSDSLRVNTEAPDHIIRSFYPLLSQTENACVVYMSSLVGQTADNESGDYHPYRAAKAASNALIWNWSIALMNDWKKRDIQALTKTPCAIAICPGWVRTDMGGPSARQSIEESTSAMRTVIEHVKQTKKSNGLYMHDGRIAEQYAIPPVLKEILATKEKEMSSSNLSV